jgi:DNA-binding transcriptional regulator YiaG
MRKAPLALIAALALAACGDSTPKQSAGSGKPIRMACTTPEQAGAKAQDITGKLVEARKQGSITNDQYAAYTNTLSDGLRAWSERQDLKAYCAALQRIVTDAGLQ